jgi:hypothetical protein
MLTPGEMVDVRRPGHGSNDNGELVAEVRALRNEVAGLRSAAERTAQNTKSLDTREGKRDIRGLYVRGQLPDDPVLTATG